MALLTPEYLQTRRYKAQSDRWTMAHAAEIQAGVWDSNDFKVVQHAAGANMSVDVGAGYALVPDVRSALYHVVNDADVTGLTVAANGSGNPRIDQVALFVHDTVDGGNADDTPLLTVVPGTPTSGATLANRTGAAGLGSRALRLADILVPSGATSIVTANIQDRRPWARGAYYVFTLSGVYTVMGTATAPSGFSTNLELGSNSYVQLTFFGSGSVTTASNTIAGQFFLDNGALASVQVLQPFSTGAVAYAMGYTASPFAFSAGRHTIDCRFSFTGIGARIGAGSTFSIQEILRPNNSN